MSRFFLLSFLLPVAWTVAPVSGQTTQPTLEALDKGVQQIYREMQSCTVRVIVPLQLGPHPLSKWMPQLDPKVREELNRPQTPGSEPVRVFIEKPLPPGGATTQPLELSRSVPPGGIPITPQRVALAEFLGLILNSEGHVLLPLFVDKELVQDAELRVMWGDNQFTTAKLIGSDKATNIAVVKLARSVGRPVRMAKEAPAPGALVLLYSPVRRQSRLMMWTGDQDEHAVVINASGALAGFVRYGHMLEPEAFSPVVEQLIETGTVKRAVLGVLIRELAANDPIRVSYPALASRPAALVGVIDPDSAAERAGVQKGDVILSVAGKPANDLPHFAAALTNRRGPTELRVLRRGEELVLSVDLEPR